MTVNTFRKLKIYLFQIDAFFYSSKNPEKMHHDFHQNINSNSTFPALIIISVSCAPNQKDLRNIM